MDVSLAATSNPAAPVRLALQPAAASAAQPGGSQSAAPPAAPAPPALQEQQHEEHGTPAQPQALSPAAAQHEPAQAAAPLAQEPAPAGPLQGKNVLLVGVHPTALVQQVATRLLQGGARVTLALRHPEDARYAIKHITRHSWQPSRRQHTPADADAGAGPALRSSDAPLNLASLPSIRGFVEGVNSSPDPVDLLVLHTLDFTAAATREPRWYTQQGISGAAQTGFLGPAMLLHLLQPRLAADGTALLLTASPFHRLTRLHDLKAMLTSWGASTQAATQAALLAYTRRLAQQLQGEGIAAASVDVGILSEQPLYGSLLRKVPPLHQMLHLLLAPPADAARLLADVAADMLSNTNSISASARPAARAGSMATATPEAGSQQPLAEAPFAPSAQPEVGGQEPLAPCYEAGSGGSEAAAPQPVAAAAPAGPAAAAGAVGSPAAGVAAFGASNESANAADLDMGGGRFFRARHARIGGEGGSSDKHSFAAPLQEQQPAMAPGPTSTSTEPTTNNPHDAYRHLSRGLLASPLVTSLDHSGGSTWPGRTLRSLLTPAYEASAAALLTSATLADWPVRALLLGPAGLLSGLAARLGPLGAWAASFAAQLQGWVPGVVGVPPGAAPEWVEVVPSGAVLDDKLGWRLWHLVACYADTTAGSN